MKINIEKSIKSPIIFQENVNPIIVYAIAAILSLIAGFNFSINFNFKDLPDLSHFFNDLMMNPIVPVLAVIVAIVVIVFILVRIIACSLLDGYIIETAKNELVNASFIMPGWGKNIKRFFWNGFRWQLVQLCYMFFFFIVPTLILLPFLFLSGIDFANLDSVSKAQGLYLISVLVIWVLFIITISLIYVCILPFIFLRYVDKNTFFSAFNVIAIVGTIIYNILDYIIAILISLLTLVVSVILAICLCITCIGILFIPLLGVFVSRIIMINLFAQVYKK